ncbi:MULTISPECIES: CBS domain-containing protein [Cohaesibacter]|uniref:CBS domain-containing protein n=1 Tax=Cohaesibacter TaxID=655352 RepID=UPI000DEA0B24|nr:MULTISPECIES: CBS domain-containing protein [Cohaesibacter]TLP48645.1 CBS domain-containing protein [Cohaesibacter sp. CAU 1516]
MTISQILDQKGRDIFSKSPSCPLSDIVKLLRDEKIGVVLISEGESLQGILSERDIVRALSDHGASILADPASAHMTNKVMTCREGDTIATVMAHMTSGRFRHMPVMEGGKVVGLVSIGDVVKQRILEAEKEADEMRAYIASA